MSSIEQLRRTLERLDNKPYGAYKSIVGSYDLPGGATLRIDRVQADPYASPSLARVIVPASYLGVEIPEDATGRIMLADHLTRLLYTQWRRSDLSIGHVGQQILERTNCVFSAGQIEFRITVDLPAHGRRIQGFRAADTLGEELPRSVARLRQAIDLSEIDELLELHRDREWLRTQLEVKGLVAFIANGSKLPRKSGDSDLPMESAVPFTSPQSVQQSFVLPSGKEITGMAIPVGVTVIVGGGYHGKSTLLRAIEKGVYPHIVGDGREWVITSPDAVSIRAEDGRFVSRANISAFINDLPSGQSTEEFTSENASGSTSQAANLVEALESCASSLLIDEDTSATNFMIRDADMRRLIQREPITPFVDVVRALYRDLGVSTVLVAGGSGAFFGVADLVLALDTYQVSDVTAQAHEIARVDVPREPAGVVFEGFPERTYPSVDLGRPRHRRKPAGARGRTAIKVGKTVIDLGPALQLVEQEQTLGIAHVIDEIEQRLDSQVALDELIEDIDGQIDASGLDTIAAHPGHPGLYSRPRRHEVLAAISRYRGLR